MTVEPMRIEWSPDPDDGGWYAEIGKLIRLHVLAPHEPEEDGYRAGGDWQVYWGEVEFHTEPCETREDGERASVEFALNLLHEAFGALRAFSSVRDPNAIPPGWHEVPGSSSRRFAHHVDGATVERSRITNLWRWANWNHPFYRDAPEKHSLHNAMMTARGLKNAEELWTR
jgi:hypothetical protein